MKQTTRRKLINCIHPETYQYYFINTQVENIWAGINNYYGSIQRNAFNVMWVESKVLLLKAPLSGSPLTAIRKRHCTLADINKLHEMLEFAE